MQQKAFSIRQRKIIRMSERETLDPTVGFEECMSGKPFVARKYPLLNGATASPSCPSVTCFKSRATILENEQYFSRNHVDTSVSLCLGPSVSFMKTYNTWRMADPIHPAVLVRSNWIQFHGLLCDFQASNRFPRLNSFLEPLSSSRHLDCQLLHQS